MLLATAKLSESALRCGQVDGHTQRRIGSPLESLSVPPGLDFGARQHQLTILDWDALARIVVHAHRIGLFAKPVLDVVANDLLAGVVHGFAACLHHCGGAALLNALLHAVTRIPSRGSACDGGDLASITAADLVAQYSTNHGTDRGAG